LVGYAVIAKIWRGWMYHPQQDVLADDADAFTAKPDLANLAVITCFCGKGQRQLSGC